MLGLDMKQPWEQQEKDLDNIVLDDVVLDDIVLENAEIQHDNIVTDTDNNDIQAPHPTDPEWHDYVMGHFVDDELKQGNPTTDGLRRVAERLVGPIQRITARVVQSPNRDNNGRSTVSVTVVFNDNNGENFLSYDGSADVFPGNTNEPYGLFPVATAETRAEGRALKRALRLRKVVAAEELAENISYHNQLSNVVDSVLDNTSDELPGMIKNNQINFVDLMCKTERLDINVEKFISECGYKMTKIKLFKHEDAVKFVEKLSEYQTDETLIPNDIKGYDSNWRSTFG